jgi:hypothetical protein
VADARATFQGAAGLDTDSIDLDRTRHSYIDRADIAARAKAEFDATWAGL